MRRREFIAGFSAATAWPLAARAQQPAMPAIGFLNSASPGPFAQLVESFRQGLKEHGFVERDNIAIEYRWAEGQYDRLPGLAADLVGRNVSAIAATGSAPAALAAKSATATIPIVFVTSNDPIELGLVASINRPGGNVTGVSPQGFLDVKKLELLSTLVPAHGTIAVLINASNPASSKQKRDLEAAAVAIGRRIRFFTASTEVDIDTAFTAVAQAQASALLVGADPFFVGQRAQIAALATRHLLPAIGSGGRAFTEAGGLMGYGTGLADAYRQAGIYTGAILKGAKPAELPVQQVSKVEFYVNLRAAKALGLELPAMLLARADEVIE